MSLLVPVVLGALAGGGATMAIRASLPSSLVGDIGRLGARTGSTSVRSASPWRAAVVSLANRTPSRLAADLALLERDPLAHATVRLAAVVGIGLVATLLVVVSTTTGQPVDTGLTGAIALLLFGLGWYLPNHRTVVSARRRRSDAVAALSSYLDLVTVLLAGGAGLETALQSAAAIGDGWMFAQIRAVLVRARTTRTSVWDEFAALGDRVGIQQLVELGASVQLAGRQGARVADSLAARAQSLRGHVLAGIEADAAAATERMGIPTVLLFAGFLFLLGYPATQIILSAT